MATDSTHFEIPRRVRLSEQVAQSMKTLIDQGEWPQLLPSERHLSDQFHVSRPTIRAALRLLANQGFIQSQKGRRPSVASQSAAPTPPLPSRRVLIITHASPSQFSSTAYHGITEMQTHLAKHGWNCETFVCPTRGMRGQLLKLDQRIRQSGIACCILISVQKQIQQWFAARPLPTLVLGSCHASVSLPSFDIEYRSVCRHAAGVLLSKGHRRLAMIVPASQGPGDHASVVGFHEAIASHHGDPVSHHVIYHDDTPSHILTRLKALFASQEPPTGLIITRPKHVLLTMLHLLRQGCLIPENVSLISRDQDPLFNELSPRVAHYAFDPTLYTKRLARLILQLAHQKQLPLKPNLLFPKFDPGESVCSPT